MNRHAPVAELIDLEELRETARQLASSGLYEDWREVQAEMLDAGFFGTATYFMARESTLEIQALCVTAKESE